RWHAAAYERAHRRAEAPAREQDAEAVRARGEPAVRDRRQADADRAVGAEVDGGADHEHRAEAGVVPGVAKPGEDVGAEVALRRLTRRRQFSPDRGEPGDERQAEREAGGVGGERPARAE